MEPEPKDDTTPDPAPTPEPDAAAAGKPDPVKRFLAYFIDGIVSVALGAVVGIISPILGGIVGAVYLVIRDGLDVDFMKHRSLGKKVMKLNVVRLDGKPMDIEASLKRNWMFGFGAIYSIPILGLIVLLVVFLPVLCIILYECYKVLTDKGGRRWGDELAGTQVIKSDN